MVPQLVQAKKKVQGSEVAGEGGRPKVTSVVPVINSSEEQHGEQYSKILGIIASAGKVTIVCGAGISTGAGIPVRALHRAPRRYS